MTTADAGKRAAGTAAAALVEPGMLLGLGTGSTVTYFLDELAAIASTLRGVPTSEATADHARRLGITLVDPGEVKTLDLVVDGADELTDDLTLTKGGGGALLREKVVADLASRFVVIATVDKLVERLGDTFPLPIEVVPFAADTVARRLRELGYEVTQRRRDGSAYRTDNGNAILDARAVGGIVDPAVTDVVLTMLPGVVSTGLFVDMADLALLGNDTGTVTQLSRPEFPADGDDSDAAQDGSLAGGTEPISLT